MGIRILMIEDEAAIADFVVRGLREEGFTVEHSPDGDDGWHTLRTGSWDVVLLDWWLPGQDGLSNTLEVHIMDLRRKLEAHGPRLIQTCRGRGYTLGE